jgi:hypothetical protein
MPRKEESTRILLDDGSAVNVKVMDGIVVDDLVVQGMKAEGYRVMTGRDVFPAIGRDIKDYLIKIGVILD